MDTLESAVDAVSGDLTASNGANVVVAVEDVVGAAEDVLSTLETACS